MSLPKPPPFAYPARQEHYVLRLYVTGSHRSVDALRAVRQICRQHLEGRYDLDVIDLREHPHLAHDDEIFASPTLVKSRPLPLRRLVGDLSDREKVLDGLDLRAVS